MPLPVDLMYYENGHCARIVKPFTAAIARDIYIVGRVDSAGVVHPIFNQYHQIVGVHSNSLHVRPLQKEEILLYHFVHPDNFEQLELPEARHAQNIHKSNTGHSGKYLVD